MPLSTATHLAMLIKNHILEQALKRGGDANHQQNKA